MMVQPVGGKKGTDRMMEQAAGGLKAAAFMVTLQPLTLLALSLFMMVQPVGGK